MPITLQAVFFDVDGVLIDSLPQHLQVCRDKADELGLRLQIPTVPEFRLIVRSGIKVSPMREFFRVVGFPEALLDRLVEDYDRDFMRRYRPDAFPGVDEMLRGIRATGFKLGLVTSNIAANVRPALAGSLDLFEQDCLFFFDRYPEPKAKDWCLAEGARLLGLSAAECLYVGDQPADAAAAAAAGQRFLAVA